jgi:hypothetical protein
MTKKLAVSLPDDVAERLAREPNVSAYVAEAVRRRMNGERVREILTGLGFEITDEGLADADAEMQRLRAGITPELRAKAAALYAQVTQGRP